MPTLAEIIADAERAGAEWKAARDELDTKRREVAMRRERAVPLVIELAKADMPQEEIAALVGVSRQTIHAIEKQARIVRRRTVTIVPEAGP